VRRGRLLACSIHFGGADRAPADPWFATDKAQHFFMAAFVQSLGFSGLRAVGLSRSVSLAGATLASSAVSVGKELYDAKHGGDPSVKDLTWDVAGIAAATVLLRRTER
jgi:uncharacterized protein YfiM (DUF2279 family)